MTEGRWARAGSAARSVGMVTGARMWAGPVLGLAHASTARRPDRSRPANQAALLNRAEPV